MDHAPTYLLCSPQGRVGTTTFARLLADFHIVERRPFALFDTDPHGQVLPSYFPRACTVADLATTRGQMALFDRLLVPGDETLIVDIWSRSFTRFFSQAQDIGFFEEAERLRLKPVFMFVTDGTSDSVASAAQMQTLWRRVPMSIVLNEGPIALGGHVHDHLAEFRIEHNFQVPPLDGVLRREIERLGFSLSEFFLSPPADMSRVVQADLRRWLKRNFAQIRSHEIRSLLNGVRHLLR